MRHTQFLMPLALVSAMAAVQQASAETNFVVRDIRVEGLQRLTPANVYIMLPINSGDRIDDSSISNSIRTLYATGLFDDIKSRVENDVLTFTVVERPIISKLELKGNKVIPKKALEEGLKKMGVAKGEVYKKPVLQTFESDLEQQYAQQGRYDADVRVNVLQRPNNRVEITIEFAEGTPSKVFNINIVGNTVFTDDEIKQAFALRESAWNSIVTRNDRYAREKMAASLESLRAMYLNKGYINFNINSADLNISEDKKQIFIDVSLSEGQQMTFGTTKFLGDTLFTAEELNPLKLYKDGDVYAQERVNAVKQLLLRKYGNVGYYFAEVNIVPQVNNDSKTVDLNYYINPGQKVTVRRINFTGNTKTADEVLRREMRQMESAVASNEKIELSKVRLERTGFFRTVDIKPVRVPNSPDQVDLNVTVEEQQSGTTTLAVGFSQTGGITFQAGLSQTNFLGTGNRVAIDLSRSQTQDNYNLSVTDPYFTIDGISRGYNVYYRKTKLDSSFNVSNYVTDSLGGNISFGYPLDENQTISASVGVDDTKVTTGSLVSTYIRDFLKDNGGRATRQDSLCSGPLNTNAECVAPNQNIAFDSAFEGDFFTYNINLGWAYNTLNRPIFPSSGMFHRVGVDIGLPGSDVDYQKVTYETQAYYPIGKDFILRGYGKLGYGNDLPFYKNFFAGGYGSVRGFEANTLGPRYPSVVFNESLGINPSAAQDPDPEPVGGNALIQFGTELVLPLPFKGDWTRQIRPVVFAEGAQVFDANCQYPNSSVFQKANGIVTTVSGEQFCKDNFGFDMGNMRYSAGVGFTWITIIGPISLSYAFPLNDQAGDQTQNVQFEIGRTF